MVFTGLAWTTSNPKLRVCLCG